jgi:alpha-L-fucosidase 2
MSKLTTREFVAGVSTLAYAGEAQAQTQESRELILWFKKPADQWTDARPIGNGRLGAMVFGGVRKSACN